VFGYLGVIIDSSQLFFKNEHQAVSQGARLFGRRSILTSM
jgi:hypothetical protein